MAISVPNWVINEIIGDSPNKSSRITELIIKGYLAEKEKRLTKEDEKALSEILLRKL